MAEPTGPDDHRSGAREQLRLRGANRVIGRESGIRPGPEVGKAYRFLLDLRLDEGVLDEAEAEARLREWWAAQS